MKLFLLLALCAIGTASPSAENEVSIDFYNDASPEDRVSSADILVQQMINIIRHVIKNGSLFFDFPPLDPFEMDHYHLIIPTEIINLDLVLKDVLMQGLGNFEVHKSHLRLSDLSLYMDVSFPKLYISTELYDLNGDFLTALPLKGNGRAIFEVEAFRVRGRIFLKQSKNRKSIIIDRIENATFRIPTFKSNLDGVIGGGDIDAIVNAIIEEVIMDYVNRFEGIISKIGSETLVEFVNPYLNELNTWKYIESLF